MKNTSVVYAPERSDPESQCKRAYQVCRRQSLTGNGAEMMFGFDACGKAVASCRRDLFHEMHMAAADKRSAYFELLLHCEC